MFSSPFIIPVVAIVVAVGVPILTSAWVDLEKHYRECELKRSMIDRGMSAEEIERVLAARSPETKGAKDKRSRWGRGVVDCERC